jgi:hypothetical protein
LQRLEKMKKHNDGIRSHSDGIADEIRKAQRKLDVLLRKAKGTLIALNIELEERMSNGRARSHCIQTHTRRRRPRSVAFRRRVASESAMKTATGSGPLCRGGQTLREHLGSP